MRSDRKRSYGFQKRKISIKKLTSPGTARYIILSFGNKDAFCFVVNGHISYHCTGGGNIINVNASTPGTIRSPWMPDFYPNNLVCVWEIRAPKGKRVKLTSSLFDLEPPCDSDFVDVSGLSVGGANPRGKSCESFPDTVSAAEDVIVRFVTGPKGRRKGFVMQYAVNKGMIHRRYLR